MDTLSFKEWFNESVFQNYDQRDIDDYIDNEPYYNDEEGERAPIRSQRGVVLNRSGNVGRGFQVKKIPNDSRQNPDSRIMASAKKSLESTIVIIKKSLISLFKKVFSYFKESLPNDIDNTIAAAQPNWGAIGLESAWGRLDLNDIYEILRNAAPYVIKELLTTSTNSPYGTLSSIKEAMKRVFGNQLDIIFGGFDKISYKFRVLKQVKDISYEYLHILKPVIFEITDIYDLSSPKNFFKSLKRAKLRVSGKSSSDEINEAYNRLYACNRLVEGAKRLLDYDTFDDVNYDIKGLLTNIIASLDFYFDVEDAQEMARGYLAEIA